MLWTVNFSSARGPVFYPDGIDVMRRHCRREVVNLSRVDNIEQSLRQKPSVMSENKGEPFNHREMRISQFRDYTLRFTLIVVYEWTTR